MRLLHPLLATFTLLTGLFVVGCSHVHKAPRHTGHGIEGTVIYITNVQLPNTATIEVGLVELDRDGRAAHVIASETFAKPPTMPLEFWLPYQPGLIDKRQSYGLVAKIVLGERVLFATERPLPVLTKGNPHSVEIVVAPVK